MAGPVMAGPVMAGPAMAELTMAGPVIAGPVNDEAAAWLLSFLDSPLASVVSLGTTEHLCKLILQRCSVVG